MIKKLSLRNFMSYVSADIPFSSGVNFICGPNGSGKSTLLVAVALALGLSKTERGHKLSDLIRWGCDGSVISLTLDNQENDGSRPFPDYDKDEVVLERTLKRSGSYPIKIDGVPSTKSELTELIQKQGINPDNMLIIMQQDMVEEFSLLSGREKLGMLEEVIEFQSYRQDLLEARDDLETLLNEERETRRVLDGSSRRVTEWERLYERYQRKRKLEDRLEDLNAEALWAKVVENENELKKLKTRKRERDRELNRLRAQMEELGRRMDDRLSRVKGAWRSLDQVKGSLVEASDHFARAASRRKMLEERLEEERSGRDRLHQSLERNREKVREASERLEDLRRGSGEEQLEADLDDQFSDLRQSIMGMVSDDRALDLKHDMAIKKERMKELEREMGSLKGELEHPFGEKLEAAGQEVESLENLDGPVFGPIYSVIESNDLEFHVIRTLFGERVLRSFVTTTESDKRRVVRFLRDRGVDASVYLVPNSALVLLDERYLPKEKGVIDWVVDSIDAPDQVRALLRKSAGDVVLVDGDVDHKGLSESLGVPVVNPDGDYVGLMKGMITGESWTKGGELLKIREEMESLREEHSRLKREVRDLSRELDDIQSDRENKIGNLIRRLISVGSKRELASLEHISSEAIMEREAERIRISSGAIVELRERELKEKDRLLGQLEEELNSAREAVDRASAGLEESEQKFERAKKDLEKQLESYYDLKSKRILLSERISSTKSEVENLKEEIASQQTGLQDLIGQAEELSPRIKSPGSLRELEKEMSSVRGSLGELSDVPDDIEGVYRTYLKDFKELKESLQKIIEKREEMQVELRRGLAKWREIMEEHLEEINHDFNEILSDIRARGRVELVNDDVREVGLDIKVGFEGKEMTSISTLTQSGGEKSLSTMAFLLALQRQVKSPFRAVDEYDVHLDPANRDKVTRLLRAAVEQDSKQYIAITPSYLSEVDLNEAENVIVVQSVQDKSQVGSLVMEA